MDNTSSSVNNNVPVAAPPSQDSFGSQPSQFQQPQAPMSPQPQEQRSKKKVIILIATILAIITITAVILIWHPWSNDATTVGWNAPETPQLTEQQIAELEKKYGYDITYRPLVSPTEKFTFEADYDYGACMNSTCADAFGLYSSADLTDKADLYALSSPMTGQSDGSKYQIVVSPPTYDKAVDSTEVDSDGLVSTSSDTESGVTIFNKGRWGIAEMYYLVQRIDGEGKELSRPKVTIFTIKSDDKVLAAVDATANTDASGAVSFSWSPVTNAKEYYVVKVQRAKADNYEAKYTVIARTNATSLNLADYNGDKSRAEKTKSTQTTLSSDNSTYVQNNQFSYFGVKTEDSYFKEDGSTGLPSGKYSPVDNGVAATSFAVIAVNNDAFSAAREIDGNALLAQTPVSLAFNESSFLREQARGADIYSFESLPKTKPITMADGHTARKAVTFSVNNASVDTSMPNNDELRLPYTIQGTYITGLEVIYGANGVFTKEYIKENLEAINKRNIAANPPSGAVDLPYIVKNSSDDLKLDSNSKDTTTKSTTTTKEIATVDYPVNGSTPLVKYIASNIMAGNYTMDIKEYYTDPTVGIWDSLWEAIRQNPYIAVNSAYMKNIQLNGTILSLQYVGISQNDINSRQKALYDQAKTVATAITNSGMSDREKALAINKWLSDNASYDYDALAILEKGWASGDYTEYYTSFPYAWNGLGTAVHKKGVCASYADAFKAFADTAGLKAITVSGTDNASGGKHAWNKAFFDNKWQVIDATWNDTDSGASTQYFGLTDVAANRVQDDSFMVDRFIGDYAAN